MDKNHSNQWAVFSLTWISYAALYLTRKNFSVVKSALHSSGVSVSALGLIDTCYLSFYALGQFLSGFLTDRVGPRRVIAVGLVGSALASFAFGYSHSIVLFAMLFGINGLFQSTGWSSNIKALEPWFAAEHRGKILGLWGTNQQVGGLLATVLAAFLLSQFGWQSAFLVPAVAVFLAGVVVYFYLIDATSPDESTSYKSKPGTSIHRYKEIMFNRHLWCLSMSYFGLKLIRYSLLFWLPFYLHNTLNINQSSAGYLSVLFEIGGVIGSIITGIIADKYFESARVKLTFPLIVLLAAVLFAYKEYAHHGILINCILMVLVGFLVAGPDSLMSGACAQDFGGKELTGSVAGFINGIGSMGAILQGVVTAYVSKTFGWSAVFYLFFIIATISATLLVPFIVMRKPRLATT